MFDDLTPVKKAAAFMAFMIMVSAIIFSKALLPYADLQRLISDCPVETEATVFAVGEIQKDEYLYYGPTVEFNPDGFLPIHVEAINTVKSRMDFKKGDVVTIAYDGTINSDVIILDDKTCLNNLILMSVVSGVISLIGIVDFIVNIILSKRAPKGETKKFGTTPDGLSFEEWQELQRLEQLRKAADEKEAAESTSGEEQ